MVFFSAGYPINFEFDYGPVIEFLNMRLNNAGDPFMECNYGIHSKKFEIAVLDWFARLWELPKDQYWGYVTSGGTEGNMHGLLVGLVLNYFMYIYFNACNFMNVLPTNPLGLEFFI